MRMIDSDLWWVTYSQLLMLPISPIDSVSTFGWDFIQHWASLVAQLAQNLPAMRETWVQSLEKGTPTHSSILAWIITWTIQSIGSQRDTTEWLSLYTEFTQKKILVCCMKWETPGLWNRTWKKEKKKKKPQDHYIPGYKSGKGETEGDSHML